MTFTCTSCRAGNSLLRVQLVGVLDSAAAGVFEGELLRHFGDAAIREIVLEAADLTFISSSGLRVLMLLIKTLRPRDGALRLVGAGSEIVKLVEMSGLDKWMDCGNRLSGEGIAEPRADSRAAMAPSL